MHTNRLRGVGGLSSHTGKVAYTSVHVGGGGGAYKYQFMVTVLHYLYYAILS